MYHGSPVDDIEVLEPRAESTFGIEGAEAYARVFASNNPAYAAGHGFRWPRGVDFGLDHAGGPVTLRVSAGSAQCLEQPLFLYVLPRDGFELAPHIQPAGYNYAIDHSVRPLRIERFTSVRAAAEFYGGVVEVTE